MKRNASSKREMNVEHSIEVKQGKMEMVGSKMRKKSFFHHEFFKGH